MLTTYDVRWACDVMRPAYDASSGVDGRVSIEVDPRLAHDTDQTVAEAKALWWLVDRPNLFIKIPATEAGMPAITATLAAGISVNVTLIFGLDRYDAGDGRVPGRHGAGQGERARPVARSARWRRSSCPGWTPRWTSGWRRSARTRRKALMGKAAIANAQLAYQRYEQVFASPRWQALAAAGAHPQRPLWASTSTKNPDYRDVMYVEELVAPGRGQHDAGADHPRLRRPRRGPAGTVTASYDEAQAVLDDAGRGSASPTTT